MSVKLEFPDNTNPYWIASTEETNYPQLNEDIEVDVAIIGGGIVGISSAYLLNQEGLKVAIIEAGRILNGTTGHTTAKITSQHGIIYSNIRKDMGEDLARQYAEANQSAIQHVEETILKNNIDCDFMWRPAFIYTNSDQYVEKLEEETKAAVSLGIKASYHDQVPLPFKTKAAMRFDDQAQFHPLKYLKALAQRFTDKGGHIYENTEAVDINHTGEPVIETRTGNKVKAAKVIIASHFPFFDGGGLFFSRIYPERSYIIAAQVEEQFPEGMFISAEAPGRSLRSQPYENGEMVLFAGEHHKTGHGEDTNIHYQNLLNFAQESFQVKQVLYRWSTQDCMTIDGVPYIGQLTSSHPNLYVATGFGKWGMSNGTAASMILNDLIVKGDNPWAGVYNPSRFSLKVSGVKTFIVQNAMVAKDLIAGKLENLPGCHDLAKGEADTTYYQGERVGMFRDEEGELHMVDTTCTHLGCELVWNNAERTWDCPCHGSRFSYEGKIVEGPAINILNHANGEPNAVEAKVYQ
jgi:FAD dependent oxidoreductase./Rieske [2Fe-2S] domain.